MRTVVVGIANLQIAVPVAGFPVGYEPARHLPGGIAVGAGGVGLNVARVLAGLGADVVLVAPLADDVIAGLVAAEAARAGVGLRPVVAGRSPRSVVLVGPDGRRQVNTDLAGALDAVVEPAAIAGADAVVLGNVDLARPLLPVARAAGVPVVVDLQDVQGPGNPYDRDFLVADVLVMSNERIRGREAAVLRALGRSARLAVVTLGAGGCLALAGGTEWRVPAVDVGPVADTTGAGDAFTAALTHFLLGRRLPARAAVAAAAGVAAEVLVGKGPDGLSTLAR